MSRYWRLLSRAAAATVALAILTGPWQPGKGRALPFSGAALAQASEPIEGFRLVWSEPIVNFRDASLSADGRFIVTVNAQSRVSLWNWAQRPDTPLWTRLARGATQAITTGGDPMVFAYTRLDPTQPYVTLLGAQGKLIGKSSLKGAIWDACVSADGLHAAITTGGDLLYLYSLKNPPVRHVQRLSGIGTSVVLSSQGKYITVGTWDKSGVTGFTDSGQTVWQYPETPQQRAALTDRIFTVQADQTGHAVLGTSVTNIHNGDGILYYWYAGNGHPLWQHALGETALDPEALMSKEGNCVAVTYTQMVTHGEQSVAERRLLVLNAQGTLLWEKGGLLFAPRLVSVASDGERVTVSDGQSTLYHLDETGRITAPYHFHATIEKTFGTDDGRWLLVYTSDGLLNLLRLG
jgi:hypothetical protein